MEAGVGEGNADTEWMMKTIKEEVIRLNEFGSLEEAKRMSLCKQGKDRQLNRG